VRVGFHVFVALGFFLDGPAKAFTVAIRLGRFDFCFSMIDVLDCQIKLVLLMLLGTAIFSSLPV